MVRKKKHFSHIQRKANAKRRKLGYVPLFENPFPKSDVRSVDMHHVNCLIVVPLPHRTHKTMTGHDDHCKQWIKKLFLLDIDTLLSPEINADMRSDFSIQEFEWDPPREYETVSFG